MSKYLHANDGVYEEKHRDEETDVRKSLLERREAKQLLIKSCQKDPCFRPDKFSAPKWRNFRAAGGRRGPWKIVRKSTAGYGWCSPASAAWSGEPRGKASGSSCWWCSPTGTAVPEREGRGKEWRESRGSGEKQGQTGREKHRWRKSS